MSTTKNPMHAQAATIRYLVLLNIVVTIALIGSVATSAKLAEGITVSIPADLRNGAILKPGEKSLEEVFAFTWVNFSSVQSWANNGEKDYEQRIESLSPFFTPKFRQELSEDFALKKRRGELSKVRRKLSLPDKYVFESESIKIIDSNTWVVTFPAEIVEYTGSAITKDIEVLYSLVVRRMRTDVQNNSWQIGIDKYYAEPIRTKDRLSKTVVKQDVDMLIEKIKSEAN